MELTTFVPIESGGLESGDLESGILESGGGRRFKVEEEVSKCVYDMYPCYARYVYAYACHVCTMCAIRMHGYVRA